MKPSQSSPRGDSPTENPNGLLTEYGSIKAGGRGNPFKCVYHSAFRVRHKNAEGGGSEKKEPCFPSQPSSMYFQYNLIFPSCSLCVHMSVCVCVCVRENIAGKPQVHFLMDRKSKTFFLAVANKMYLFFFISGLVCGVIYFHSKK